MTQNEMSNSAETNTPRLPNVGLPGAGGFKLGTDPAPDDAEGESNAVFGSLVTGDSDIVGLVAYSIYKQNKHDWLIAYNKAVGRKPTAEEIKLAEEVIGKEPQKEGVEDLLWAVAMLPEFQLIY